VVDRRPPLRHVLVLRALAPAVLALAFVALGPSAHIRAQAPTQAPAARAGAGGLWLVHPDPSNPSAQELALLTSDGFMFASNAPTMPPDPDDQASGITQLFSSQGYGVWQPAGDRGIAFKFLEISYDQNGDYAGSISIHGNLTLNDSRDAFTGTYTVTIFPPAGTNMDVATSVPVTGTRVTVNSGP
jgi:hypothetical protein